MIRLVLLLLCAVGLALPGPAAADPADINAAARGVVRVVVIGRDGEEIFPVSHGSGFAVGPETIVTNAHVVAEAIENPRLTLGIVPSDGGEAVFGRLVAVSKRNDLALLRTTSPMRLPPLTISGAPVSDAGAVTSVGYPQNVDRAQGLEMADLFRAQPPVKSTGFLSGRRPTREFDTLLHTAPIARGSSGGPLLDECGRVLGVNSFGAESGGTDAEFFFAVSTRELLPFLRANDVTPSVNAMPCRSLADLDEAERQRIEQQRNAAQVAAAASERTLAQRRDEARRDIEFAILDERDSLFALAVLLLLVALAAGGFAYISRVLGHVGTLDESEGEVSEADDETARPDRAALIGGSIAMAALAGAAIAWLSRPGFSEVEQRLKESLRAQMSAEDSGALPAGAPQGELACSLEPQRSRVTGEAPASIPFAWTPGGCVNARAQYGFADGVWTRVLVPASEAAVSVNSFDPASGEFVIERYLLDSGTMREARLARGGYEAPACDAGEEAVAAFGEEQSGLISMLPDAPNERLVYTCAQPGPVGR